MHFSNNGMVLVNAIVVVMLLAIFAAAGLVFIKDNSAIIVRDDNAIKAKLLAKFAADEIKMVLLENPRYCDDDEYLKNYQTPAGYEKFKVTFKCNLSQQQEEKEFFYINLTVIAATAIKVNHADYAQSKKLLKFMVDIES